MPTQRLANRELLFAEKEMLTVAIPTEETWTRANADWMREARWGVMIHYLADQPGCKTPTVLAPDDWNRRVDAFDVPGLVNTLQEMQAKYLIFTLGQNSGFYCSPNATYDALVGAESNRLSRRDLVGEIAEALTDAGIRLIAYLPSHAPANHRAAVEALDCTPEWDASGWGVKPGTYIRQRPVDQRLSQFQKKWEAIIREWSTRWGQNVSGWWIDGCYYADRMYRHPDGPNFRTFAQALKAGNPDSLVAFNPGVLMPIVCHTPFEDYTAGEVNMLPTHDFHNPMGQTIGGAQTHVLSFLGEFWCQGQTPRYPDELVTGYTRYIASLGGAMTWDVPIRSDGQILPSFARQLRSLGKAMNSAQ